MLKLLASLCSVTTFCCAAQTLTIAAAADLAPLEQQLAQGFEAKSGGRIRFVFASSGRLAEQVRQGAPYDIYLSANDLYTQQLVKEDRLERETVRLYALGRVGLSGVKSLAELKRPEIRQIAIPNPKHAPYGVAAEEILRRTGLLDALRPKLVLGENARQTREYCRSGNADACLTAWTLSKDTGGLLLPASQHQPIRQSGGVVKGTPRPALARAFMDFLLSIEGQTLLVRAGLNVP